MNPAKYRAVKTAELTGRTLRRMYIATAKTLTWQDVSQAFEVLWMTMCFDGTVDDMGEAEEVRAACEKRFLEAAMSLITDTPSATN